MGLSWPAEIASILPKQEGAYPDGLDASDWINTDWMELWTRRRTLTEGEQGGRLRRASLTRLPILLTGSKTCSGFPGLGLKA